MEKNTDDLKKQAISLLHDACGNYGILASSDEQDNYRRLWSRDAMVAGIAGLLVGDEQILSGFEKSICTLARYQHPRGMIPSNVLPDDKASEVSYGGLAGRVDATGWFVAGACLYLSYSNDEELKKKLQPALLQSIKIMDHWEFNANDLLYTPRSGNWADEYPVEGHTLYDNALRLWGLEEYANIFDDNERLAKAKLIRERIIVNFWPDKKNADHPAIYHPKGFEQTAQKKVSHFACSTGPAGYNFTFDAAGHGLALLLGLADSGQKKKIEEHVEQIFEEIGAALLPAFWPVIRPGDPEWFALQQNYSFNFKNEPHHFHNGGIWPVWMGLFGLGLSGPGSSEIAEKMLEAWMKIEDTDAMDFYEYIASDSLKPDGKRRMSYSASGLIFLLSAIENNHSLSRLRH